ncbi:MAG: aminotransferase class III-fold pyridoxal phosphate-dependent enzyme [Aquificaceae bacterium]|nr:aminotransferase class III-fold pyridoxal phosphate-dependent enzyme [Aquificaceae bacterium]
MCSVLEGGIQGAAGMLPYPKGLLKAATDLCRKKRVLSIVDEVATGFGRTGSMFYCEQEQVSPDFMCLGKGLSGGYLPVAATLTTNDVFEAFLGEFGLKRQFYHGHTYTGNNLGCASALASLEVFEIERTLEHLPRKIELLKELLEGFSGLRYVWDVRRLGFMAGIELRDKDGKPFDYGMRVGFKVARACRDMGVFLRPLGDTMVIMLPLCANETHIERTLNSLKLAIENLSI